MKRIFFFFLFLSSIIVFGQIDPPEDSDAIPVDGGISLLLAAGAAWGVKKLKDKR